MFIAVLPFLWFVRGSSAIVSGKYRRVLDFDYLHLTVHLGENAADITYHNHTRKNVPCVFTAEGSLNRFLFHRVIHRRKGIDYHRQSIEGTFTAFNDTFLLEIAEGKEALWKLVDPNELRNFPVEIAIIQKTPEADEAFMHHAFTVPSMPRVYYWDGIYVGQGCPTVDTLHGDSNHTPAKIVGTSMAHYRIWQEFYRRYKGGDQDQRIFILEGGIHCAQDFCGDIALEQIASTSKDILYVGWCHMQHGITSPPYCLHAYSISVRAAALLIPNVYPCLGPADVTVRQLCRGGNLTWALAAVEDPLLPFQTEGLHVNCLKSNYSTQT